MPGGTGWDEGVTEENPLFPPFTTKVAVVVRDDLESWQRLNVTAFLVSGITAARPELVGAPYEDAEGRHYLKLLGVPVMVFEAGADALGSARRRAADRGVEIAIYTRGMFTSGHDADNRAVVRAVAGADLDLVGIGLYAPRGVVDKIIKGARLHPWLRPWPPRAAAGPE